jgi:hypothetical protein
MSAMPAGADDKDFLRPVGDKVPPNLLIVFGNSQTMTQPISFLNPSVYSTFNGDADSPVSKLGAAKKVIRQFVSDHHTEYNIGLTGFSRPPNLGSTDINRKHWIYEALETDFPNDSFKEIGRDESAVPLPTPGTLHRWGPLGEGPCTSKTSPACTDQSPAIALAANATIVGPFFAFKGDSPAYIYLNGDAGSATERIRYTMTAGEYGDAFTADFNDIPPLNGVRDPGELATLATLALGPAPGGTHSIEITKQFQIKDLGTWKEPADGLTTIGRTSATVIIKYRPPVAFPQSLFYTDPANPTSPYLGKAVGFLNEPKIDFDINTNCSGWEFQQNSGQVPLIKIPRDYLWDDPNVPGACNPPQDSLPCAKRLLRPQAYIETYNPINGAFDTDDPDNPGYESGTTADKYADGCDPNLLGAVQNGLDDVERTVILSSRNGNQAPVKNILENIYAYFTETRHDGFLNGARTDDPNGSCRNNAVIFIYDTYNGCQNDSCGFLKNAVLTDLKAKGIPVYVIGFGANANSGVCAGSPGPPPIPPTDTCPLVCIAEHSGALKLDGSPGYFPVTTEVELLDALLNIASLVNESQKGFVASTVSTAQAAGEQVTFLATFNATNNRSIWNGRINAYKLNASGNIQMGVRTIRDLNDPLNLVVVPAPSNAATSLMWNAGENLGDTPGTGATTFPGAVLAPGAALSTSTYVDGSNDATSVIGTSYYPGRKIVFSLPQGYTPFADPTTLPIPAANAVPEIRQNMVYNTAADWWPALRTLLTPQSASVVPDPPFVANPPIDDLDAGDSLRFIWGDRDNVIKQTEPNALAAKLYSGLKLGDIFHASPVLVGAPNDFPLFTSNLNNYQAFRETYRRRRRVLYFGANDGLLHAVDAGAWNRPRTPSPCDPGAKCYDLGTGAELFAYAPRSIMQIFKGLKDTIGPQTRRIQWTVDGPPTAGDVFIDSNHTGTPDADERAWHTVLIGGMREGSAFEGTTGEKPMDTLGSYYALDITQPDELVVDAGGAVIPPGGNDAFAAGFNAPLCLDSSGDPSCGRDSSDATVRSGQPPRSWPTVLWEITDVGDLDAGVTASPGNGFHDMGESWAKPSLGRVKVCTADCGTPTAVLEDRYVAIFGGGFDRERLNRRGNWLYIVDVETGHVLYRANSGCANSGSGCSTTYFASMTSEPSSLDGNGDGVIDIVYVGDLKGRLWRIDLTDLRLLSSATGRFDNKIDMDNGGSGKPFLFFEAPQPVAPAKHPFYPIYYRPVVISLGFNIAGKPAVGVAFGTGDRDDITSSIEPLALTFKQRYYYIVDRNNSTTLTETDPDLLNITSPTAASVTTAPTKGWFLQLALGERINADALAAGGVVFFTTFNPLAALSGSNPCAANVPGCGLAQGTARLYRVFYSTGNPYLGTDRGQTQQFGGFLSEPVYFQSQDQQGNIIYTTENTVKKETAPGAKKTTVKSWKERSRRP